MINWEAKVGNKKSKRKTLKCIQKADSDKGPNHATKATGPTAPALQWRFRVTVLIHSKLANGSKTLNTSVGELHLGIFVFSKYKLKTTSKYG